MRKADMFEIISLFGQDPGIPVFIREGDETLPKPVEFGEIIIVASPLCIYTTSEEELNIVLKKAWS